MYIEEPLNKQWVVNALSYSTPVVSVRKNYGMIRLYCDYPKIKCKTIKCKDHPRGEIHFHEFKTSLIDQYSLHLTKVKLATSSIFTQRTKF